MLFVGEMLLYTFTDKITGESRIGVFNPDKHLDFAFSDVYLTSLGLFQIAQGFNKTKNVCFLVDEYNGIVRSYDFENGQIQDFPFAVATNNKLRGQPLGFSADKGDWFWALKRKLFDGYGFDLALLKRDGSATVIDSGYFNIGFFTNLGEQTKFIYVKKLQKGAANQREIVLFDPKSSISTRIKAYASNQLLATKNDFTDLWLDENRDLMVYSSAPKTFCVLDLALNKVIRTFKIEQEYESMEFRGTSGLLEISFKSGIKKWIQIDSPAKPLQWHIEQLKK
jgi:hypothetical protein